MLGLKMDPNPDAERLLSAESEQRLFMPPPEGPAMPHHARALVLSTCAEGGLFVPPEVDPWAGELGQLRFHDDEYRFTLRIDGSWADILGYYNHYLSPEVKTPPLEWQADQTDNFSRHRLLFITWSWKFEFDDTVLSRVEDDRSGVLHLKSGRPHHITVSAQ